ncbi:MAG: carbon-nitrogen hydrolase family protein [Planctomycetes bacterium]|nr:carbon-nitrogen hydrolase family protein [Planctomycetota bacterium]
MPTTRIAAVQCDPRLADVPHNRAMILQGLTRAARRGAQLVVFPECALSGYGFASKRAAWPHAETVPGPFSTVVSEECRRLAVWTVFGMLERDGPRLFNSAVLAGPRGLVGRYRKVHLPFLGVDRFATRGDRPFEVHRLPFGRIGMHICYDGSFPEAARSLRLLGADLLILPTNWPEGAGINARHTCLVRAHENHVHFVACNRVGTESGFRFIGRSQIIDCNGRALATARHARPTTILADLDLPAARRTRVILRRGKYELDRIGHRRPEFYGAVCKRRSPDHR